MRLPYIIKIYLKKRKEGREMRKQREREGEFRAIVRREKEEFVQSFTCNTKYVYIIIRHFTVHSK